MQDGGPPGPGFNTAALLKSLTLFLLFFLLSLFTSWGLSEVRTIPLSGSIDGTLPLIVMDPLGVATAHSSRA